MPKKLSQLNFIKKCVKKHGDKFDYSKIEYINSKTKIVVGCPNHGWFDMPAWKFVNNKCGCNKCGHEFQGKQKTKTTETFISESKIIFGDLYDYSKSKYIGCDSKIEIICKRHGSFFQRPANHLFGMRCIKCRNLSDTDSFVRKSKEVHGDLYDYSNTKYTHNRECVEIICKKHGIFKQKAGTHLDHKGCPTCNLSKGELKIRKWLMENKIEFIQQAKFADCINEKTGYKLKYDFYIPSKKWLIEYDGKQHFMTIWDDETEESFKNRTFKDSVKTKYALNSGLTLTRIKYTNFKNLDDVLNKTIAGLN